MRNVSRLEFHSSMSMFNLPNATTWLSGHKSSTRLLQRVNHDNIFNQPIERFLSAFLLRNSSELTGSFLIALEINQGLALEGMDGQYQ